MHKRFTYTTASAEVFKLSGIGVTKVSGLITPGVLGNVLADNQAKVAKWELASQVADYSAASMLVDPQRMLQSALSVVKEHGALAVPTALVVPLDALELFDDYSRLMGQAGILRVAFTSFDLALRWAQREGAIYQQRRELYHQTWPRL